MSTPAWGSQNPEFSIASLRGEPGDLAALVAKIRTVLRRAGQYVPPGADHAFTDEIQRMEAALDAAVVPYADELAAAPSLPVRWELERHLLGDLDRQLNAWGKTVRRLCSGGWPELKDEWHAVSWEVEQLERQRAFVTTLDPVEFEQQLWWMIEPRTCDRENLVLVRRARATLPLAAGRLPDLLARTDAAITQRLYDPAEVCDREEKAYQQHRARWDREHRDRYIAVHWGEVIASHPDRGALIEALRRQQEIFGPLRAYIIRIGAPVLHCTDNAVEYGGDTTLTQSIE